MRSEIPTVNKTKEEFIIICKELLCRTEAGEFFFLEKSSGEIICGCGNSSQDDAPLLGGKSFFSEEKLASPWEDFDPEFYFRPEIFLHWTDGSQEISIYSSDEIRFNILRAEVEILFHKNFSMMCGAVCFKKKQEYPSMTGWEKLCEQADIYLKTVGEKLVLSRAISFEFSISERKQILENFFSKKFPLSHKYILRQNKDIFLGASPEFLFQSKQGFLQIPAIAGTRSRGRTEREDKELERDLLHSSKERNEHKIVVHFIREVAEQLGLSLPQPEDPKILKLSRLQHLYTNHEFSWDQKSDIMRLLQKLHPTPAMGGMPRDAALYFLRENESYERGYFTGPIGYQLPGGETCFVVGIRALLLKDASFYSFAGAGYVEGSHWRSEWVETEQKMQTILQVFDRE